LGRQLDRHVAPLRHDDPKWLGRYRLVGRLGQGGMGTVYLGRDRDDQPVAVKVIRGDRVHSEEFRRRFRSEVRRAQQVPPFCTAEVLDADPDHEHPYLVVEFVDGPSLADVIEQKGPLSAANLHGLAIGVATALSAIHSAGVVHRDLKPANVLLPPGSPKVIDFGIATAMEVSTRLTAANMMLGTVEYLAPERIDIDAGNQHDPSAADIFAWGALITYAGTGVTPFEADSPTATAARILTQPPDVSRVKEPLRTPVTMALAKNPGERPGARELLDMLLGGSQPAAGAQPDVRRQQQQPQQPQLREASTQDRGLVAAAKGWFKGGGGPPREPFGGWGDYRTWAEHGFIQKPDDRRGRHSTDR
jgi:eukaryotic-like serine/threonine-protein kinase